MRRVSVPIGLRRSNLRQSQLIRPEYAERFRCIGPACEDSCCQGWAVPVDQPTFEKYQSLPASPLRILLDESLERTPDSPNPLHFARIKMQLSHECPFFTAERLCRIQAELGEDFLSRTCATYPRIVSSIDNLTEKALSLSCPEAARLVLLDPILLDAAQTDPSSGANYQITWDDSLEDDHQLLPYFWPIREFIHTLVRNRDYPLWQRLFLLGSFCRRLAAVASGEAGRTVPALLRDFPPVVATGKLRPAMENIAPDLALQLDMVLQLAGLCRERSLIGARFLECLEFFKQGIGFTPTVTMAEMIAAYGSAQQRYFTPFFDAHPHILENYLVNTFFRLQFPFGMKDGKLDPTPDTERQFALLATQYALIKGLLIGVAGCHKEQFAAEHVIHTVQATSKHFEHHPQFLDQMHELLRKTGCDSAHGLTMLLRN
jgi:lysine-N-methylase